MIGVIAAVAFGLAFGSFANVAIDRLQRRMSLYGHSRCDSCLRTLAMRELIPVASYLMQRGRCATCRAPIGWRTPAVEAGTGAAFGLAFAALSPATAVVACVLALVALVAGATTLTRIGAGA